MVASTEQRAKAWTREGREPGADVTPRRRVLRIEPDLLAPRVAIIRNLWGDRLYEPHEVIEIELGRRRTALERDRRIRTLEYGEEIYQCSCGRRWVGDGPATAHPCVKS